MADAAAVVREPEALRDLEKIPAQRDFVWSPRKFQAYFGGRGNGKSSGGVIRQMLLAELYPTNRILLARQTYGELQETILEIWRQLLMPRNNGTYKEGPLIRRYVDAPPVGPMWEYRNGTVVVARSLDNYEKRLGPEYGSIYIDQAEETEEEAYLALEGSLRYWTPDRKARFRAEHGFEPRHFMSLTGNPAPCWVKDRWVEDKTGTYHMINAASEMARKVLPPGYIEHLRASYPAEWVARFVDGSWDTFEGQVWKDFNEKIHVVPDIKVKGHWELFIGLDHGYRNQTAVLWGAVDEHGNVFIFQEHYQAGWVVEKHAARIRAMSEGYFVTRTEDGDIETWMDPSVKQRSGINGKSVWEEYLDNGIVGIAADNDPDSRILRVAKLLGINKAHRNPFSGIIGAPRLYISQKGCPQLIKYMKKYRWADVPPGGKRDGAERPRKKDDHLPDALQYLCQGVHDTRAELPVHPKSLDPAAEFMKRVFAGQA